jgi:predicted transcriptional regulator
MSEDLMILTADIVSAHVSNNSVSVADVPTLIQSVFAALSKTAEPLVEEASKQEPAVSVRTSIKPDYIVCLEDGKKLKMLKRYLCTNFDMSPEQYRAKWNLPKDYPMVAPNYAAQRKDLAMKIGLGRKPGQTVTKAADGDAKPAKAIAKAAAPATKSVGAALESARQRVSKPVAAEAPKAAPKPRGRPKKAINAAETITA